MDQLLDMSGVNLTGLEGPRHGRCWWGRRSALGVSEVLMELFIFRVTSKQVIVHWYPAPVGLRCVILIRKAMESAMSDNRVTNWEWKGSRSTRARVGYLGTHCYPPLVRSSARLQRVQFRCGGISDWLRWLFGVVDELGDRSWADDSSKNFRNRTFICSTGVFYGYSFDFEFD